jgi:hypothetical protein
LNLGIYGDHKERNSADYKLNLNLTAKSHGHGENIPEQARLDFASNKLALAANE